MGRKRKILIIVMPIVVVLGLLAYYLSKHSIPVLSPAGTIAEHERHLMIIAILLAAIVVIPVYALTIMIAIRYREDNPKRKAKYDPDWDHSRVLESIWWGIPIVIIGILSVITWNSSHELDPYKPLSTNGPTLNVQVVSLDWKWLFIYPGQNVASVNQLELPVNIPVHFYITSDTVMNSFWIPALSGQIYAMPGMQTQLNLEANKLGSFYGSSANISGKGFAGMHFMTNSVSMSGFNNWVNKAKSSQSSLNDAMYVNLARASQNNPVSYYKNPADGLFNDIIQQYMLPGQSIASRVKT
jgi:cytochrome o ubiquinol oxidase subunit 2